MSGQGNGSREEAAEVRTPAEEAPAAEEAPPGLAGAVRDFVEAEGAAARRSRSRAIVVGVLASVLVFGYLWWLRSSLEDVIHPQAMAEFLSSSAVNAVPQLGEELEETLMEVAPRVAADLADGAVNGVPELGQLVENELDRAVEEMATFTAQQSAADLADLLAGAEGATPEARVEAAAAALVASMDAQLKQGRADAKGGKSRGEEATVLVSLQDAMASLERINARLGKLAARDQLTHQEQLEKRLIQSWMQMVKD